MNFSDVKVGDIVSLSLRENPATKIENVRVDRVDNYDSSLRISLVTVEEWIWERSWILTAVETPYNLPTEDGLYVADFTGRGILPERLSSMRVYRLRGGSWSESGRESPEEGLLRNKTPLRRLEMP